MRGLRLRLDRLERMSTRSRMRNVVGVGLLPGADPEVEIQRACERAGVLRDEAMLAIVQIEATGPQFVPPTAGDEPAKE